MLRQLLTLLSAHPNIIIDDSYEASEERTEEPEPGQEARVPGNLIAVVERLDDELFKSLQVAPFPPLAELWPARAPHSGLNLLPDQF